MSQYEVTEEEILNGNPPLQTRLKSFLGNHFYVVVREEVEALEKRLREQREIAKFGSIEAYEAHMKEERVRKEQEIAEHVRKERADATRRELISKINKVLDLSKGYEIPLLTDEYLPNKSTAKKEWFLRDKDLEGLPSIKIGRSIFYDVRPLIEAAEKRALESHTADKFAPLSKLLVGSPLFQKLIYARVLLDKFEKDLESSGVSALEFFNDARNNLLQCVSENEREVTRAHALLNEAEQKVEAFGKIFGDILGNL